MDVLLISPYNPIPQDCLFEINEKDFFEFWNEAEVDFNVHDLYLPNKGIGYLADYLRKRGKSVALFDMDIWGIPYDLYDWQLLNYLKRERPKIIGISCNTANRYI